MTKTTKQYLALLLILLAAVLIYAFSCGNTLTLSLKIPLQATGGSVTAADETVAVIAATEFEDGFMHVTFCRTGQGSTLAHVNWEPADNVELSIYDLDLELSSSFTGGLRESVTGIFTGWQGIVTGVTLFLLLSTVFLLRSFIRRREKSAFSYRTILCAGLGIFMLVLTVFCLRCTFRCFADPNMTMWLLYLTVVTACQRFFTVTSPLVILFALGLLVSNIALLRHEGLSRGNLFGFAAAFLMLGGLALGFVLMRSERNYAYRNLICNTYATLFCYYECMLIAVTLCVLGVSKRIPEYDMDYVMILGCRIRPDGTLYPLIKSRVDKAYDFAKAQEKAVGKRLTFLPSGGQGADECLPEAEAMARYLRQRGVDDEHIAPECHSTSTWENLCYSKKLVEEQKSGAKAAFSTSDYHVFRSGMLAQELGWDIPGMGSKTKWYFWSNAFLREFVGLLADKVWTHLAVSFALALFFALLTNIF